MALTAESIRKADLVKKSLIHQIVETEFSDEPEDTDEMNRLVDELIHAVKFPQEY